MEFCCSVALANAKASTEDRLEKNRFHPRHSFSMIGQLRFILAVLCVVGILAFAPHRAMRIVNARGDLTMGDFEWKPMKKATEEKMTKTLEGMQSQFNTLRAGGATPAILDRIMVDYFGSLTPLNQVARVAAANSQTLVVEPFDKSIMKEIEKAISMSDLNLNPNSDGDTIRINIPPLTEERRKELVKQAKTVCEDGKVSIRNIRREGVDLIKKAEKDKDINKDDCKGHQVRRRYALCIDAYSRHGTRVVCLCSYVSA
jgi:ribosome recycling factor